MNRMGRERIEGERNFTVEICTVGEYCRKESGKGKIRDKDRDGEKRVAVRNIYKNRMERVEKRDRLEMERKEVKKVMGKWNRKEEKFRREGKR